MINTPKIYKMRVVFTAPAHWDHKQIFVSLRNMVLRSGLPFEPAKVNKNWPRLAYGPVLGYGQQSLAEYADVYFSSAVKEEAAESAFTQAAPKGLKIKRIKRVPYALPSVNQLAEVMLYGVEGDFSQYKPSQPAEAFFGGEHIILTEQAANAIKVQRDLKPFLHSVKQVSPNKLHLLLQRCADKSAKPEHMVAAWLDIAVPAEAEFTLERLKFIREALYWRDAAGELHVI